MNGHFLTKVRLYAWYPASAKPPQLSLEEEMSYQLILNIALVGVVAGFYDHKQNKFCKNCERYFGLPGKRFDQYNNIDAINKNLAWTYEPVNKVLAWMLIPLPVLSSLYQAQPEAGLN
ncbi:hypothetical protein [Spirosoma endbachense]|uniref:Uncharacterized protein n=1 Tax=Spirosoma endbachense TaxID=2666025 RepID=A0A6P1W4Q4_9BACT|nr:hypothetical protein [Spirosoma endbachense]QHW00414.1 hypothetical protein GJR95_37710 [Spirosoma endbachense]